jgi:hypothetical protein
MEYNIVMVNPTVQTSNGITFLNPLSAVYSQQYMKSQLESNGADPSRLHFLPQNRPISRSSREMSRDDVLYTLGCRILETFDQDCLNVLGITNYHGTTVDSMCLAEHVKLQAKAAGLQTMIIGGGPSVARESFSKRLDFPDSATALLLQCIGTGSGPQIYDGVVQGGTKALVGLLGMIEQNQVKSEGGIYVPNTLPQGYYLFDKSSGKILGEGTSSTPVLSSAPFIAYYGSGPDVIEKTKLVLMFTNRCENACGFCSLGNKFKFSVDQIRDGVREAIQQYASALPHIKEGMFKLEDPNPLSRANIEHTYACFDALESELGFSRPKYMFVDSTLFKDPNLVLKHVEDLNIRQMYVGRDAVTELGADFMQTKTCGTVKTQDDLRDERKGLEEVIRKAKERGRELDISVSYIITPVETKESLEEIFEDMKTLKELSDENVKVKIGMHLLSPHPRSKVIHSHTNLLAKNYEDVYLSDDEFDMWNLAAILREHPDSAFELIQEKLPSLRGGMLYADWNHNIVRSL